MTRLSLLTVALVTFASAGTAAADSYVSLGFGDASASDLGAEGLEGDSIRLGFGQRFGKLALEASLAGTDFDSNGESIYGTTTAAVDLKYHLTLGGPFELYGKGGLNKTWDSEDQSGRGLALGLGLQWNLRLPVTSAAIWLDYTHVSTELRNESGAVTREGSLGLAMLGASIGF